VRILQLHTRYRQQGGEDAIVDSEAELLRNAGHDVRQFVEQNPDRPIPSIVGIALSPWNPAAVKRLRHEIADFNPDVAHVHNTWFAMSPAVIRCLKSARIPVVMTLHNYRITCANGLLLRDGKPCEVCVGTGPWPAVAYGCYRDSRVLSVPAAATISLHKMLGTWTRSVDRFIVHTEFQRDLMTRAGLSGEKLTVKPNSVPDPGPRIRSASKSTTVLFAGRISEEKGVDHLVEAWRTLDPSSLQLVIAGGGPMLDEIRRDLPASVVSLGMVTKDRLRTLMLSARAAVLPSVWYEGMPLALLESFAAGLPVAASNLGAQGSIVGSILGNDWLFEAGDKSSLSSVLKRFEDDDWCDSASLAVRAAFEERFTEGRGVEQLQEIYRASIKMNEESAHRQHEAL
jgi:glycosyltransferase involved in cell wall biosynthesis